MLERLIPPDEPHKVTRWRWGVFIALGLLLINSAAGRGIIPGFAYASEHQVEKQGEKLDKLLALQIASIIRDLRKEECAANGSKSVIQRTIDEYQAQYIEITGRRYPIPQCTSYASHE